MNNILPHIYNTFLSHAVDFRVRLFNVLAFIGSLICLSSVTMSVINNDPFLEIALYFIFGLLSTGLLVYATKTGQYQRCYKITIFAIFLIGFPVFFWAGSGYYGAMPYFFVFAIAFTIFMLEGKSAVIFSLLELSVYVGICVYAYLFFPVNPRVYDKGYMLSETIFGVVTVSIALGFAMIIHFRIYNEQQRKLDAQNTVLSQTNRAKTEFLANTSHEMRTPLTVVSVNVQRVMALMKDSGEAINEPGAMELLADAQSEIIRMSRMVGGMLTLASISESAERNKIDLTKVLKSIANVFEHMLEKSGNKLETEVSEDLTVFGDADLLSQATMNLIQNAHAHTENDSIILSAVRDGGKIAVTVKDNGSGISPEMLPRVFERGVSGKDGGTGFGLFLCKTVVESHGGEIRIESEPGKGTKAYFTLPVYEGQYGGDKI